MTTAADAPVRIDEHRIEPDADGNPTIAFRHDDIWSAAFTGETLEAATAAALHDLATRVVASADTKPSHESTQGDTPS